jgi:hypothetical protein
MLLNYLCGFCLHIQVKKKSYRIAICIALIVVLLLIWAELAVGILEITFSGN